MNHRSKYYPILKELISVEEIGNKEKYRYKYSKLENNAIAEKKQ